MKTKEEQKRLAHEIFNAVLREWMEVNRLSVNDAQEHIGVSRGVFHSWTMRPNDPKFPTFVGFLDMINKIESSFTNPVGRHERKFNFVKLLTGEDFTKYEQKLEEQLQEMQKLIQQQKGAIKYLESKLN